MVSGSPISLLKKREVAIVGASRSRIWASRSLVVVLPTDPVSAMTTGLSRSRTSPASFGQRADHVIHQHARPVDRAGAQHRDGAGRIRRGCEVVAVAAHSGDGREQGAGGYLTGVDDHPG